MPDPDRPMLAAVYKGEHTIAVEEIPVPKVGPGQVLLEVSHCGVCGSDVHTLYEDWGTPGSVAGHEYSGVVSEVGAGVTGWQRGDRAVGGPARAAGGAGPAWPGGPTCAPADPAWEWTRSQAPSPASSW